jgi:hypothetical protein
MVDLLFLNILLREGKSTRKPGRRYVAAVYGPHIVGIELHSFLTSALDADEWAALHPQRFYPFDRTLVPIG